jgi:hypothetical protein
MNRYSLFFVDQNGNLLPRPRVYSAGSEAVAAELAEGMRSGRAAELWCDGKRLRTLELNR